MAKLSRSVLKALVKECLVEILAEGIGDKTRVRTRLTERKQRDLERQHLSRSKALDNIQFKEQVENVVGNLTQDPLMKEIFADTATTTLQEQAQAESYPGGISSPMMSEGSPGTTLDSFGDASRNWAALAFADKKIS